MKTTLLFMTAFLLTACSSAPYNYKDSESIQQKIDRYLPMSADVNRSPEWQIPYLEYKKQTGNLLKEKKADKNKEVLPPKKFSHKKLYFLTLYSQYQSLSKLSPQREPELEICPRFHSVLIDLPKYQHQHSTAANPRSREFVINEGVTKEAWGKFPELSLPLVKDDIYPRLGDALKENHSAEEFDKKYKVALHIHTIKTFDELQRLCEYGVSNNFYLFQNMIDHFAKNDQFRSSAEALKVLMKSPTYSNLILLTSIGGKTPTNGRMPASNEVTDSINTFEIEIIHRLDATWSEEYLDKINQ